MKNKIIISIILLTIMLSGCSSPQNKINYNIISSPEQEKIMYVDSVYYDNNFKTYSLNLVDENGESYIIDITKDQNYNKGELQLLTLGYYQKWLSVGLENEENSIRYYYKI